jgi:hypothetical protein
MQFCSPGFWLSRLIRFRLVSDHDDFLNDGGPTLKRRCLLRAITSPLRREYVQVNAEYAKSRRDAFLVYPTIPLAILEVLPLTSQQTTTRIALNLATERTEERRHVDVPTLPIGKPHDDPGATQKIIRVWKRTNGGWPEEVVTFQR